MRRRATTHTFPPDPLWFKEAIIYELHVRAFADSNGDGIGDIPGLIDRLDYLHDLGVTALWLLPFYPSPGRDGGYDIADYVHINPVYGDIGDFKRFLREAHRRGIRVITELVLNHTSSDHAWFERSRRAPPGSRWREFYVWSDTSDRYTDSRIIFKDFETSNWSWDPIAKAYYWHRFYFHQPELNFDNPEVHEALIKVVDFWLGLGVDGLRLDAVPYLYEREGTNCENLPETHAFLKKLRAHVDSRFPDRMLLAEANQWPVDAAAYFGNGDECHMNFHFPLMPRMFMAVQLEDRFPIVDIIRQTPTIPDNCQWATFLRNHDELTLEMVTDEDRDYMYRVYAEDPNARINLGIRRRLSPLLRSRRKVELMKGLLFSLPGTPVLYYGDEIGMGDNIYLGDRDGVRTPMQWSPDRNAGFSLASPQRLYLPIIIDREYHFEATNVEVQQQNPSSLLWWTKRLISLRKAHRVFGAGSIEFLYPDNSKVLAFTRSLGDERVLVVANLSRFVQHCELDLSAMEGLVPMELFGRVRFPPIGRGPYFLSLGPHSFYWFALEPARVAAVGEHMPSLGSAPTLAALLGSRKIPAILGDFASARRWYRAKARTRKAAHLRDIMPLPRTENAVLALLDIDFEDGDPETYLIAPAFASGEAAAPIEGRANALIARARVGDVDGVVYDALATGTAAAALTELTRRREQIDGAAGEISALTFRGFKEAAAGAPLTSRAIDVEQTNSVFPLGDRMIMKVFRAIEAGPNPELEMGQFLSSVPGERCAPRLLAGIRYRPNEGSEAAVATIHELVAHEESGWDLSTDALERYYELVLTSPTPGGPVRPTGTLTARAALEPGQETKRLIGAYLEQARILGRRTALLHRALAGETDNPAFAPEPFTAMHQQSIYQWGRTLLVKTFDTMRRRLKTLSDDVRGLAEAALAKEKQIDERLQAVTKRKYDVDRIRCHGDLHLGQVLFLGSDFLFIDFEGEPSRRLSERRYKRTGLRDATGMLRSFAYAAESSLRLGPTRSEDLAVLEPWARAWVEWVSAVYLGAYLRELTGTRLVPRTDVERDRLLDFYQLEKVIYEISYEQMNRPAWLGIPLRGLLDLLVQGVP